MNRPLLVAMVASVVMGLACSGVTGGARKGQLRVGKSNVKANVARGKHKRAPRGKPYATSSLEKGWFVVKIADNAEFKKGKLYIDGKLVNVDYKKLGLTKAAGALRHKAKNGQVKNHLGLDRQWRFRAKAKPELVISTLEKHPAVEWVEPITRVASAGIPNDPYFEYQWHMKQLEMPKVWDITEGEGVVVAVIDSGVSAGEDGYYKVTKGWDFVENDATPQDENGHGSHVAGTIAQATNNGIGVAGVAPKATIMPIRVLDANGGGTSENVANGIIWAVDNGADIINMSLGGPMPSEQVADACRYAYDQGVTIVAATGNDGFTDFIGYPAGYPTTIAVGAVDSQNKVTFYSNQGEGIHVTAPGGDTSADRAGDGFPDGVVQETLQGGAWSYSFFQGTSMATPHVAGIAALLHSKGIKEPDAILEALTKTADDKGASGYDITYGYGVVNPLKALDYDGHKSASNKLKITHSKVWSRGPSRAVVGWLTNEPSNSSISGPGGFKKSDDTKIKAHKIVVQGKPGSTVTYTVKSQNSHGTVSKQIKVTF